MNKIQIIGTEPPCPRCGLLTKVVTSKVKEYNIEAEIEHVAYTDIKARVFAMSLGLAAGTAKDVANKFDLDIDKSKLTEIVQNKTPNPNCEYKDYNTTNWSFELDEFLRPFEKRAKDTGILMTPVLIINGEVKHSGSVPKLERITHWLNELI